MTAMQIAYEERQDFAELLAGLSPEQWEQPSLCEHWRVRDVVAHVLSYDELSRCELVRRFAKGGYWPNRINAIGVAEYASRSPEQLTELMRACIWPQGPHIGFGGTQPTARRGDIHSGATHPLLGTKATSAATTCS